MYTKSQPKEKPGFPELFPVFEELLPVQLLREWIQASGKRFYERLFTPLILVWCFLYQRLNEDHTCDAAVSHVAGGAVDHLDTRHKKPASKRIKSENTSAYSEGRKRLPLSVLQEALRHTGQVIRQWLGTDGLWFGHPVGLLDGTTILLRPEPELVAHYGRHQSRGKETYWVVMRVVAAFCLCTGALIGVAEGALQISEQALAAMVFAQALSGNVYVGDRNFGVFSVVQAARRHNVWVVLRMTKQRARALAGHPMQSGEDLRVSWQHSVKDQLHPNMSAEPIEGRLIFLRLERNGFRPVEVYLFTTLSDAQRYTVAELIQLYGLRWHVELDLRYVKSTLEMDLLTGKSVDIVRKELHAGLLAYNIIRGYMVQAARKADISPLTLSFTRCWRRVREVLLTLRPTDSAKHIARTLERLLVRLVRCILPKRPPFRIEPRAVHPRPSPYPKLKGTRADARQRLIASLQKEPSKS